MSLIPTAIELLNCAQETIDALKAELSVTTFNLEQMTAGYESTLKQLARERERSEKLAQALESLVTYQFAVTDTTGSLVKEHCRQALLAAKQDEAPRCKHGVHGNDCRQCYPTINDESI